MYDLTAKGVEDLTARVAKSCARVAKEFIKPCCLAVMYLHRDAKHRVSTAHLNNDKSSCIRDAMPGVSEMKNEREV